MRLLRLLWGQERERGKRDEELSGVYETSGALAGDPLPVSEGERGGMIGCYIIACWFVESIIFFWTIFIKKDDLMEDRPAGVERWMVPYFVLFAIVTSPILRPIVFFFRWISRGQNNGCL